MAPRLVAEDHDPEVRQHLPLLMGGRFSSNLLLRFPAPFLAVIGNGLGVSLGVMGVALSVGEFAGLLSPLAGRAADRHGARAAMVAGLGLLALAGLLAAGAPVVAWFAGALVLVTLAKTAFDAATTSWIADRVPFARRAEVVGTVETTWALALLVGVPLLAPVVAGLGWRAGYVLVAVLVGVSGVAIAVRLPLAARVEHAAAAVAPPRWWRLPRRSLATLGAVSVLMGSIQVVFVVEGAWFQQAFGFSTADIGLGILAVGAAELCGSFGSSRLTDRVGKRRSIALGAAVMAPAMASLGLVGPHAALGIAVVAVGTFGFEFALVSAFPLVVELDTTSRGTVFTLLLAGGTAMRGLASIAGGFLFDAGGIAPVGVVSAGLAVVALVAVLAVVREPEG